MGSAHSVVAVFAAVWMCGCSTVAPTSPPAEPEFDPLRHPTDAVAQDMAGLNEAAPHGVPAWWDWARSPVIKAGNASGARAALTAWGQVHVAAEGNTAVNTRIQLRDLAGWWLRRSDGTWHPLGRTRTVWGAEFAEDFAGNTSWPADTIGIPGEGLAVKLTPGRCFHFYWRQRGGFDPDDLAGLVCWFEARLVTDSPAGPDDRDVARFVASVGADYYAGVGSSDAPLAVAHGKTKYVRREWRRFYMTTLARDSLRQHPLSLE